MKKFSTRAIHNKVPTGESYKCSDLSRSASPPIYQTSTFHFEDISDVAKIIGQGSEKTDDEFVYTRGSNPTIRELELTMADLEQGEDCICFSSGMAAITAAAMSTLKSGDHAIVSGNVYGDTNYLFEKLLTRFGVESIFVDITNLEQIKSAIKKNTKIIIDETPSNPLLWVADIKAISKLAREKNIKTIVDNTFATPYLQNPLNSGADIVVHSATKYLGGHSDVLGGMVISDKKTIEDVRKMLYVTGAVLDPFAAWLILRGIKTLAVRMDRHCENTKKMYYKYVTK